MQTEAKLSEESVALSHEEYVVCPVCGNVSRKPGAICPYCSNYLFDAPEEE